jgi:hypothetical protein
MTYVGQDGGAGIRPTLLWFPERDPCERWKEHFGGLGEAVAGAGLGRVEPVAPSVPAVVGTDRCVGRHR